MRAPPVRLWMVALIAALRAAVSSVLPSPLAPKTVFTLTMPVPSGKVRSADRAAGDAAAECRSVGAECAADGTAHEMDAMRRMDPTRASTRFLMTFLVSQRDGVYRSPSVPGAARGMAAPGVRLDRGAYGLLV